MKKRAKISRKVKSLKWMHKTPSKTKRKKVHILIHEKKVHPYQKKCLQLFPICGHDKNMESRTQLNIRKTKFTT